MACPAALAKLFDALSRPREGAFFYALMLCGLETVGFSRLGVT
jgi:hypothetical protein